MIEFTNPMIIVFLISITISFILSIMYKFLTNQEELKNVNEELKELNSKLKEAQKNKNQKELMKLQSRMLEINSKKMRNTMKPMMASFLIVIPVFVLLLPSLYGDLNVELDDSSNGMMKFGDIEKNIYFSEDGSSVLRVDGKEILSSNIINMGSDEFIFKNFDKDKNIVSFKRVVINLPFSMPIWGSHIGWLGWYILASIPFTTVFRKALGIVQ